MADQAAPVLVHRLLSRLGSFERGLAVIAFLVLVTVVFLDVVSREIRGTGLPWALQLGLYGNWVMVLMGLGVASADGAHLRPRFADRWLPATWEPGLIRLQELVTALCCAGFLGLAVPVVLETRELAERGPVLGNLLWPLQAVLPLVFGLGALRHGLYALWPGLRPAGTEAGQNRPPAA